jgi:hypothetical protein
MGLAGLGAVVASSVQASGDFGMGQNVRDVILTAVAVVGAGMGGGNMRAFALGFGAAAVGSLIRRNVLTTV